MREMLDVTATITAFNRPQQLERLVLSIVEAYPEMPIIVGDNGEGGYTPAGVKYHRLPFDCGISASRNFLVHQVKTPYLLLLDDDFIFDQRTRIETLLAVLQTASFDIVAGSVDGRTCHGLLELADHTLYHIAGDRGTFNGYPLYDMVLNFFLARTAAIKEIGWDPDLKMAEHLDFFLRARGRVRITYLPAVVVGHDPARHPDYAKYRRRARVYGDAFMKKYDIRKLA